jgi:hypothetical protein
MSIFFAIGFSPFGQRGTPRAAEMSAAAGMEPGSPIDDIQRP